MKKKKKGQQVILRLHVVNYSEKLKDKLLQNIGTKLYKQFRDDVKLRFWDAEQYWKIPEHTECYFRLYFPSDIKNPIEKLKEVFGIEKLLYFSPDETCEEKAIWNSSSHGGIFIDEHVVWVSIYILPYSHPAY